MVSGLLQIHLIIQEIWFRFDLAFSNVLSQDLIHFRLHFNLCAPSHFETLMQHLVEPFEPCQV